MSDHIPEFDFQKMIAGTVKVVAITAVTAGALIYVANFIGHTEKKVDEEAVNARIQPVAKVELAAAGAGAAAGSRSGEDLYKASCAACHDTGAAGAPKMGDKGAWGPRIGVGLSVLAKTAKVGKGAMPPKGGSDATDEELARAIVYMANKSGASFKEPAAGAKPAAIERKPEDIAKATCFKCHETGANGAPKLSDAAAWRQRQSKGIDAVIETVIRGHGKMPARGGLAELTDAELKTVVGYILKTVDAGAK